MKLVANEYKPCEIIKIVREWSELSQKDFAQVIHCSKASVQSYEQGRRNFTFDTFLQIAKSQGLTITIEKKEK